MQRFMTVAEAEAETPLKAEAIREALRAGTLHGAQNGKGGTWYIAEACLEAYMFGELCAHRSAGRR